MRDLTISLGKHRADTTWKPQDFTWDELVERLGKVRRTAETMAAYDALHKDKAKQGEIKDGASFVGGTVLRGRRKKENMDGRSLVTLDADFADDGFLFDVELVLGGTAYVVYSTHSHRVHRPKYRLVVPLDRDVTPDEYAAVSRRLAEQIGIEVFDRTTFDVHRLMYFPSCSVDAEPVLEVGSGELLSVDDYLATYANWADVMAWPRHPGDERAAFGKRAQDPREKTGTLGAFCRAYTIEEGIAEFLSDVYEEGTMENRYTYLGGSSGNGLEVYPAQELAFSHQDSDPVADNRTYNLFDLVRVHTFGHLDKDAHENTAHNKLPSHTATEHWAKELPAVKRLAAAERAAELQEDFGDMEGEDEAADDNWADALELHHKTLRPLPTGRNAQILLSNGPWAGVLGYDAFGNTEVILSPPPWRGKRRPKRKYEPWLGSDDKELMHWFEVAHRMKGASTIQNAFTHVVHRNEFHPIKQYIEAAAWDGVPRAEQVFIHYLGAEDTHYARQVTRKMLLAAVTRLYEPGAKFDQVLVLVGPQGAGKSSLLAKLGREWFSDSLRTFDNKEAGEHLQNGWIFEIGELSAMNKSDFEDVKAFLSKTEDRYRVAYDRQVSEFPRKAVFFGTTNNREFLRDPTGNRRFWPVEVRAEQATRDQWEVLTDAEVSQIWAEVLSWYRGGESLQLDKEAGKSAEKQQAAHMEGDAREGIIREWLDEEDPDTFEQRTICCAAQVWEQALGRRKGDMKRWDAVEICNVLRNSPGWAERPTKSRVPGYGLQRVFERI